MTNSNYQNNEASFFGAVHLATQPNYLGNPDVVIALLQPLFEVEEAIFCHKATYQDRLNAQQFIIRVMTEEDTGYVRMPGWHTETALGANLIQALNLDQDYCEGESLTFLVSEGLAAIGLALQKVLQRYAEADNEMKVEYASNQVATFMTFVTSVFLGTNAVMFPGATLDALLLVDDESVDEDEPTIEQLSNFQQLLAQLEALDSPTRLPPFTFAEVSIPTGTTLYFKLDISKTCTVMQGNKVLLDGELLSLSKAAVKMLNFIGRKVTTARGPDYWLYEGITLTNLREEKLG